MITALRTGLRAVGQILRALVAAAILAVLLAGVPVALVVFVGWPLPELVTGWSRPLDDAAIFNLLAVIAWILWAVFARDVIVEILLTIADASDARHGQPRTPRRPTGSPVRLVAAVLVGIIAGTVLIDTVHTSGRAIAGPPRPSAAVVEASDHLSTLPATAFTVASNPASAASGVYEAPGWARDAPGGAHLVVKDDNYWDVAESTLGDPYRWREIWSLTRGQTQPDGRSATDPDKIYPGWWLALPAATASDPPAEQAPTPDHDATETAEQPAAQPPTPAATPATAPVITPGPPSSTAPAPATSTPTGATTSAPGSPTAASTTAQAHPQDETHDGVTLPSQAWVSLGLAGLTAAIATLLRLQRRRHARITFPVPTFTGPAPSPVPPSLRLADAAGTRLLTQLDPTVDEVPDAPAIVESRAPIGLDPAHREVGLFDLTAGGIGLRGDGAAAAARAILASALATAATGFLLDRPVVTTTSATLTRLLPAGVPPVGLDPHHETFDGDRLTVVNDTSDAIAVLEDEMVHRWRLLESEGVDTIAVYNTLAHADYQLPAVLLVEDSPRHHARLRAIAGHANALELSVVIVGDTDVVPTATIALDGTITQWTADPQPLVRLSTLDAGDLDDVLNLIRASAARPEPGRDFEDTAVDTRPETANPDNAESITAPAVTPGVEPPIQLNVLGPVTLAVADTPITGGLRSGSLAVLALLAAHPNGRTREEIMEDLHPGVEQYLASQRVGTDNGALRRVLTKATGITGKGRFITYDPVTGRYRLDPDLFDVDLWHMITAIQRANNAADDTACLAALRQAADYYLGDFGTGHDRAWIIDYATTYRHQYLSVLTRIAEILEPDYPDQAIAAIEQALTHDPVNEELYQRLMRIHGRADRPDEVRRVLRRLTNQLADVGDAEPSAASKRVADRQLNRTPRPSPSTARSA